MPALAVERFTPRELTQTELESLIDRVHGLAAGVFGRISRDFVAHHFVNPPAQRSQVILFVSAQGQTVGMQCIQAYEMPVLGRPSIVFRAQAAMLPAWRGGSSTIGLAVREYLRVRLRHPLRPVYYFGVLIHPSSYTLFANWTRGHLWPSPDRNTPHHGYQALMDLGTRFDLAADDPQRPLVRSNPTATIESEAERRYWRQSDKPAVRYFLREVPHPERGDGLMVLVPLGWGRIADVSARLLGRRGGLLWTRRRLAKPSAEDADRALRSSLWFSPLTALQRRSLIPALQWRVLRAGEHLFRQGDPGDALYLIVSGSAYIILDSQEAGGRPIDTLMPGEVVGEVAVLTGQPRSATVRAAARSEVLRLGARELLNLLQEQPELEASLWQACCRRLLRGACWDHPMFDGLDIDRRDDRLRGVRCLKLAPGEPVTDGALRMLVRGRLHNAEQPQDRLEAPALLPPAWRGCATGSGTAVLAVLPE